MRDQLVGKVPKDYDVATNASPEQVRELFGRKRTLAIGESFGVITVLGPKSVDPIEVATFRRDTGYSDGRHPDAVEFTDAREDAIRRDFTINGMFYDPITEQVIDYVGGQEDLDRRIIRAIGDPHERIAEDKLRMLRAIRFAATFDFEIEAETLLAVQQNASQIKVVSGERIGSELRRMLSNSNRAVAVRHLNESKLLPEILAGCECFADAKIFNRVLDALQRLEEGCFVSSVCILVEPITEPEIVGRIVDRLANDWKLSNDERKTIQWVLANKSVLSRADQLDWSILQPVLIKDDVGTALKVLQAESPSCAGVPFCQERLQWPNDRLDPKPFLDGNRLRKLGIEPGPLFGKILSHVRAAQLDGQIETEEQAEEFALQIANSDSSL